MDIFFQQFKNKKGFLSIEIVIGTFIFIMTMCVFVDLSAMIWKHNVVSQTNSHIARILSIQGGVCTSAPIDFPGGKKAYITSSELYNDVQSSMKSAGFKNNSDWEIIINGKTELVPGANIQIPTNKEITINMKAECRWGFVAKLLPGQIKKTITSKRVVISSYSPRTGDIQYIKKK